MARRTKEPAIIIKGLSVPKNCESCWYGIEHNFDDGGECFAAGILELTCEEFHGEYRPGKCPIVAVNVAGDSFAVDPTFYDAREGLKSAHRRTKPHLIGKLFNDDVLSP